MTWVICECGCGYEGEDPVTQYLVEEACALAYELHESRVAADLAAERERVQAVAAAQDAVARELAAAV